MFVYELSGFVFESSCSHLNFRFGACYEKGVPWHSGNCRVWIHSETGAWHDKNTQSSSFIPWKQRVFFRFTDDKHRNLLYLTARSSKPSTVGLLLLCLPLAHFSFFSNWGFFAARTGKKVQTHQYCRCTSHS